MAIRNYKHQHEYHNSLHSLLKKTERLCTALILLSLGAAIAGYLLKPMNWQLILGAAVQIVFLVRPLAGVLGLMGFKRAPWREWIAISFFGNRGIGSLYYFSYALNNEGFEGEKEIWTLPGLLIVISFFVHGGISGAPVISKPYEMREKENKTSA